MNKTLSFIRLDYITVKPYLTVKNLVIFVGLAIFLMSRTESVMTGIAMFMIYITLYVTYPFAVGEKNGIDALYITLSIKRGTVVQGRYLFALLVDICAGIAAFALAFATSAVLGNEFDPEEILVITGGVLAAYSIMQAIQLPIFFKLGYTKAKFFTLLPFIILPFMMVLFSNYVRNKKIISAEQAENLLEWINGNVPVVAAGGVVLWLLIMLVSYRVSVACYRKREF